MFIISRIRILVVDDEVIIVGMLQTLLEQLGYRVTTATASEDALEKIRVDPSAFDLILTDQTMPGLSGAELWPGEF